MASRWTETGGSPEIPLAGGDVTVGMVRVGDTLRRPRGPWSDAVAAYLRHLQAVGFDAAPRHLGIDAQGRDVLEFVAGEVPSQPVVEPWAASPSALVAVARLLRRLHEASASFVPPPAARWYGDDVRIDLPAGLPPVPAFDVISHFDVTPQNVVFRARAHSPVAVIDFDQTRPGCRMLDVINTAMWWVPLMPAQDRDPALAAGDVPGRLRAFVAAYGLDRAERAAFLGLAADAATHTWYRMRANATHLGGGWARMWAEGVGDLIRRRRAWMLEEAPRLNAAVTGQEPPTPL